jgi:hypothetical protein
MPSSFGSIKYPLIFNERSLWILLISLPSADGLSKGLEELSMNFLIRYRVRSITSLINSIIDIANEKFAGPSHYV